MKITATGVILQKMARNTHITQTFNISTFYLQHFSFFKKILRCTKIMQNMNSKFTNSAVLKFKKSNMRLYEKASFLFSNMLNLTIISHMYKNNATLNCNFMLSTKKYASKIVKNCEKLWKSRSWREISRFQKNEL